MITSWLTYTDYLEGWSSIHFHRDSMPMIRISMAWHGWRSHIACFDHTCGDPMVSGCKRQRELGDPLAFPSLGLWRRWGQLLVLWKSVANPAPSWFVVSRSFKYIYNSLTHTHMITQVLFFINWDVSPMNHQSSRERSLSWKKHVNFAMPEV